MTEAPTDGVKPTLPPISSETIRANLLTFGRRLRGAGLPVGSGQILSLVDAMGAIDVFRHDDVYHASRSTVVTRPEQIPVFDLEFSRFWRELMGAKAAPLDPFAPQNAPGEPPLPDASKKRTEQRHTPEGAEDEKDIFHVSEGEDDPSIEEEFEASPDDVMLFSAREILRRKDFSQCTPEEIAEARRIIESFTWRLGTRKTRRRIRAKHGKFIDPRATLRGSMRHGGMPLELHRQKRKIRTRPLVVICDISGSMDRYSGLLVQVIPWVTNRTARATFRLTEADGNVATYEVTRACTFVSSCRLRGSYTSDVGFTRIELSVPAGDHFGASITVGGVVETSNAGVAITLSRPDSATRAGYRRSNLGLGREQSGKRAARPVRDRDRRTLDRRSGAVPGLTRAPRPGTASPVPLQGGDYPRRADPAQAAHRPESGKDGVASSERAAGIDGYCPAAGVYPGGRAWRAGDVPKRPVCDDNGNSPAV